MENFKNSPLWLIGFFILFAEAIAGIAAIKIDGWPQGALVIFVISYSTIVTAIFFAFLWFKPENFYGPNEYRGGTTPEMFIRALKGQGFPSETVEAVAELEKDSSQQFFKLLDNLIQNNEKQFLVLLKKNDKKLSSNTVVNFHFATRNNGLSMGTLSVRDLMKKLKGTELLKYNDNSIELSDKGDAFAGWFISEKKDAKAYDSNLGGWGDKQDINNIIESLTTT